MKITKQTIEFLKAGIAYLENPDASKEDISKGVKIVSNIMRATVGLNGDWLNFNAINGNPKILNKRRDLYECAVDFLNRLLPYVEKN